MYTNNHSFCIDFFVFPNFMLRVELLEPTLVETWNLWKDLLTPGRGVNIELFYTVEDPS